MGEACSTIEGEAQDLSFSCHSAASAAAIACGSTSGSSVGPLNSVVSEATTPAAEEISGKPLGPQTALGNEASTFPRVASEYASPVGAQPSACQAELPRFVRHQRSRGKEGVEGLSLDVESGCSAKSGPLPGLPLVSQRAHSQSTLGQPPVRGTSRRKWSRVFTPGATCRARPQTIGTEEVWPERWGITRGQIKDLLRRLRADPLWHQENNVYTLVSDFIIPWTEGQGLGYALLVNRAEPKEVNIMVSHAWGENAEEFLEALLRSTVNSDVVFICALSMYQAEDDAGPSIPEQLGSRPSESPFRRILMHIRKRGDQIGWRWRYRMWLQTLPGLLFVLSVVSFYLPTLLYGCVPAFHYCAEHTSTLVDDDSDSLYPQEIIGLTTMKSTWQWKKQSQMFPAFICIALGCAIGAMACWLAMRRSSLYAGRMVVVPNREMDVYTRLWCVYEIYVTRQLGVSVEMARTLAKAGKVGSRDATCSCEDDMVRISGEIEAGPHGYEQIDKTISLTTRGAHWNALKLSVGYGLLIAIFVVAAFRIKGSKKGVAATVMGITLASFLIVAAVFGVFRHAQGMPSVSAVVSCAIVLLCTGVTLELLHHSVLMHEVGSFDHFVEHFAVCLVVGGSYIAFFLAIALFAGSGCPPRCIKKAGLPVMVSFCLIVVAVKTLLEAHSSGSSSFHPILITNASFVTGCVFMPAYMSWSAAVSWGVRIRGCCPRSSRNENPTGGAP
mmetsp:Transcript_78722/g.197765  ORF Transcript_78722/g.197765 Transcript_78722/m.197765 type:complete len:726 (+) Transcript_78722:190-2367(+)